MNAVTSVTGAERGGEDFGQRMFDEGNMQRARRRHRAAVAHRLLAGAADDVSQLDWDTLDMAPEWLAFPQADVAALAGQVGALVYAAEIRLWIDRARVAAAGEVIGTAFLSIVLALSDTEIVPPPAAAWPCIDSADQVGPLLRSAGGGVLLASITSASLREVVSALLAPVTPSPIAAALARSLVERAQSLAGLVKGAP